MISVLTPTCDRPAAMALARRWMARQTVQPDEWLIAADGGGHPPGALNFIANLRHLVTHARGDLLVFVEDDDHYRADHIEQTVRRLEHADLVGGMWQPYYNVHHRCWRLFRNRGSSLCQTGMSRKLIPLFLKALDACAAKRSYGVDGTFWDMAWCIKDEYDDLPVIGIKGLPGAAGLGVGHRPDGRWHPDPECEKLREWVGDDWRVYAEMTGVPA